MLDIAGTKRSKGLQAILTVKSLICYLARKRSKMRNRKRETSRREVRTG
jgi:hypothetical protein